MAGWGAALLLPLCYSPSTNTKQITSFPRAWLFLLPKNKQLCLIAFLLKYFLPVKIQNLTHLPCFVFFFKGREIYVRLSDFQGARILGVLSAIFIHETQCVHFESFTLKYKKKIETHGGFRTRTELLLLPSGLVDNPLLGCAECDLQETNTCSGLQDQPLETFKFLTWHFIF